METNVVFEQKISVSPKEFNALASQKLDALLLKKSEEENAGRCSVHGWVKPGTLKMLSRSMLQIEGGRFTGDMVSWVQIEGTVIYPVDGAHITGIVLKKNKMGMFVMHKEAIQVMVPRDLHIGNEEFDSIQIGETVEVEIKKSRFQVKDPAILSVGIYIKRVGAGSAAASRLPAAPVFNEGEEEAANEEDEEANEEEGAANEQNEEANEEEEAASPEGSVMANEEEEEANEEEEEANEEEENAPIKLNVDEEGDIEYTGPVENNW